MPDFEHLDFYELLGISRSASVDEIKRAYRREISKYHPDRFVNAPPEQQEYARRRSQALTEAYSVLSDFAARNAYNLGQPVPRRRSTPSGRTTHPAPQPRDYQAELYEQAREHLAAGRTLQAIGVLRQLQQINPFYRDSARLLAEAEAQVGTRRRTGRNRVRLPILIAGGLAGAVVLGLAARPLLQRVAPATIAGVAQEASPAPPLPTSAPTALPAPTQVPAPTEAPAPTQVPTLIPAPTVTEAPVPTQAPAPTATQAPAPEQGELVLVDSFDNSDWAEVAGAGWSVGYAGDQYRIAVDQGIGTIWSYRTGPVNNYSIGVDARVVRGEGGLLLRFVDELNFVSFSIDPSTATFRLEQRLGGSAEVLADGQSDAIAAASESWNRMVAQIVGNRIRLLLNGQVLADVEAENLPASTRYGLLAISGDTAAEAFFDNLELRTLESLP